MKKKWKTAKDPLHVENTNLGNKWVIEKENLVLPPPILDDGHDTSVLHITWLAENFDIDNIPNMTLQELLSS